MSKMNTRDNKAATRPDPMKTAGAFSASQKAKLDAMPRKDGGKSSQRHK